MIRNILRDNIAKEYPDLRKPSQPPKKTPKRKSTLRRLVVPLFDTSDSSDDEFIVRSRHVPNRRGDDDQEEIELDQEENNDDEPTVQVREMMLNYVLDRIRDRRNHVQAQRRQNHNNNNYGQRQRGSDSYDSENKTEQAEFVAPATENDEGANEAMAVSEVTAVIEHNPDVRKVIKK